MRAGLLVILVLGVHRHLGMRADLEIHRRYRLDCSSCRVSSYQLISLALGCCLNADSSL
jgi:hypothetical protein